MPAARQRYIADLLQIHFEDLAFLGGQRRTALHSQQHTLREFGDLAERIEAHVQGLLVAPPAALRERLVPQLASSDRDEAFAAALALLRCADSAAAQAVIVEFSRVRGATLAGLRDALSLAPPAAPVVAELQSALDHAKPATAAAAAAVLANHRRLDAASPRLATLLGDEDADTASLAWRAVALADASTQVQPPAEPPPRPFGASTSHASAAVRDATWFAAAWSGQPGALPALRQRAAGGDAVALGWLAALGTVEDAPVLRKAAMAAEDPQLRCGLLARFGHPSALNALVRWMDGDEVVLAAASGEAFARITGHDVRSERRTLPVPDDADDFEREMAPDVWLPDAAKARDLLQRHGEGWAAGARWCRGHCVDAPVQRPVLLQLDLHARWDAAARAAMAGQPISTPPPIH